MPRVRHDPSKNLVGFLVGDVMYAVRIEVVREIVNPLTVVALPRAPKSVKGVADYRGEVVPVVDLRDRFGLEPTAVTRRTKWVVLDVGGKPASDARERERDRERGRASARFAALVVDVVTEVFGLGKNGIRPAPPLGSGDDVRGIEGVTTFGDRLVFVLDSSAFSALAAAALGSEGRPGVAMEPA